MSSTNLTWDEAIARAELIDVHHYSIALDLTDGTDQPGEKTFTSTTTVRFSTKDDAPADAVAQGTFIDLRANRVTSVELNGRDITQTALTYCDRGYDSTPGIALTDLREGENLLTVVAECEYSSTGEGLHRYVDPADSEVYLYTQFETADAKRVFTCFDQPDLKATYSVEVTTPKHWKLITNGTVSRNVVKRKTTETSNGADHEVAVHTATVDYPLSTYLIAFMAGPYSEVRDVWRGTIKQHPETPQGAPEGEVEIPLGLYCRRTLAADMDSERLMRETKEGFGFYAERFGVAYPFIKYDQVFCPEYNMGAMENAGAVTIREDYIFRSATTQYLYERRNDTILHEMAHMWFGDLVTMKWWNDLWLNESFATWTASQAQVEVSDYKTAWVTFAHVEKAWAYKQDQLSSTHPITTDASDIETVDQNFDGITYAKGASVLKQLAAYVGLEPFLAGVRLHFARHSFGNATFSDLLGALEQSSGRDLSGWADMWLKTTGVNRLGVKATVENGQYSSVVITQTGAQPGAGEFRDHRIGVGVYSLVDGTVRRTASAELDISGAETPVSELVRVQAGDFILPNDEDLTYALIDLDDDALEFVVSNLEKFEDPMARALCWSAAWDHVRSAKLRARDFIQLVARGLAHESETAVVQQLVRQVVEAGKSFADPEWMDESGWDLLVDCLVQAARSGEPGGDTQLAAVKELAHVRANASTVEIARAILDENPAEVELPGLATDTDMKWLALKILAAASAGGEGSSSDGSDSSVAVSGAESVASVESLVSDMRESDKSSLGDQAAVEALALIPTTTNKESLWTDISSEKASDLSNRTLLSKVAGFFTPGRGELLPAYTENYFDRVEDMWSIHGGEMALRVLPAMYPAWDDSDESKSAAQKLLDRDDLPAGLRRLLVEGKDRQERIVRARACDRG